MGEKRGYYEPSGNHDVFHFPVTVFAGNVRYNGLHWHDHGEMIYCKKGITHLRVEGVEYTLHPGDFHTIPGGASHEIFGGEAGGLQIVTSIDEKALEGLEGMSLDCSTLTGDLAERGKCEEDEAGQIRHILGRMAFLSYLLAKEVSEKNRLLYQADQYALLAILSSHKKPGRISGQKQDVPVRQALRYIHEHLSEPISAGVLAGELHVSEPTVYRLFREQVGVQLKEYTTQVRLEAACRYLQMSSESITEIAYLCGFTGLSNFYRVFAKELGMTPKEYRRKHPGKGRAGLMNQPDIMKLNYFEQFTELGYPEGVLMEE